MSLLQKLNTWRAEKARKEGVELYRVLSNATLEQITHEKPADKAALLAVKGIAEKKYRKYGSDLLGIVNSESRIENKNSKSQISNLNVQRNESGSRVLNRKSSIENHKSEKVRTVGEFLDFTNTVLQEMPARVRGEVSSVDIRGSYLFYTIKDAEEEASLSVFMWRNRYDMCGVTLEVGMEIIIEGHAEIYKPSGRFSFRADSVELVGEGALKAAYERLKSHLEQEGLFAPERKRAIPHFPQRIGLITSQGGAVIHDFLNNIGRFGYTIRFVNSRVEGQLAVADLMRAVKTLEKETLDVLVVIRGGGSLESLQAFNNEALVRVLADFPVPVICGIGHDKDMPLASMVADMAVSTPTAVTKVLNSSWEQILSKIDIFERDIFRRFEQSLYGAEKSVRDSSDRLMQVFADIVERCRGAEEGLRRCTVSLEHSLSLVRERITGFSETMLGGIETSFARTRDDIRSVERSLTIHDPRRNLRLGYSIVRSHGKVVRSVESVRVGEDISVLVSDGEMIAGVKKIRKSI